jgi:hypothetical protein
MNDRMQKLRPVLLITWAFATSYALAATIEDTGQLFDPTHGVILSGSEGNAIAARHTKKNVNPP